MEDRLRLLLKIKNVTAASFADAIGMQRSSVSHVLNGRNKPGMDFIAGILKVYPDVSAEWLITGKGKPLKDTDLFSGVQGSEEVSQDDLPDRKKVVSDDLKPEDITPTAYKTGRSEPARKKEPADVDEKKPSRDDKSPSVQTSSIPFKAILIYKDGTFEVLINRNS